MENDKAKKIYTVMVIEDIIEELMPVGGIVGGTRIVGWYENKDTALEMVRINAADIHEYLYRYALVEEIQEGLYQPATKDNRWFFKYNEKTHEYEQCKDMSCFDYVCGLTIG